MTPPSPVTTAPILQGAANNRPPANNAKLHAAAKQFEAMFMGEMLRQTRPTSKAAGVFSQGNAEKSWQALMDQALGQAAVAQGGSGLGRQIEQAMRAAQNAHSKGAK